MQLWTSMNYHQSINWYNTYMLPQGFQQTQHEWKPSKQKNLFHGNWWLFRIWINISKFKKTKKRLKTNKERRWIHKAKKSTEWTTSRSWHKLTSNARPKGIQSINESLWGKRYHSFRSNWMFPFPIGKRAQVDILMTNLIR